MRLGRKTSRWAQYHRCAFLAINSAQDIDRQLTPLLREYRSLSGLASIRYQGDRHIFDIAWWGSDKGISAQQQLMVQHDDAGWRLAQDAETSVQPRSDEKRSSAMCACWKAPRRCRNTGRCLTPTTRSSTPGAPRKRRRSSSPLPKIRKLNSWAAIFIPCVASAVRR